MLAASDLMLPVFEDYLAYAPPAWVKTTVGRLLDSLAAAHVAGLSAIVLTESGKVRKGRTQRIAGRKYTSKDCLGFYRARCQGEPPAVFLIVDNVVGRRPSWLWLLPLSRDAVIGAVLFHEIGHHLNATVGSLAGGDEASAEKWKRRLTRIHFRRKCWYLRPLRVPLRCMLAGLIGLRRAALDRAESRHARRRLRPGQRSPEPSTHYLRVRRTRR